MCLLLPITRDSCPTGRGGISALWVIPSAAVTALSIGSDGRISGISLDCELANGGWTQIEPERNTGYFTQAATKIGANTQVTQTIRFTMPIMTNTMRRALALLSGCCSLHAVILDNAGAYHYAGISTYIGGMWQSERLSVAQRTGSTGDDSATTANEYSVDMQCTTNCDALHLAGSPIAISNNCALPTIFGTSIDGDTAFGPVAGGSTVFGTAVF